MNMTDVLTILAIIIGPVAAIQIQKFHIYAQGPTKN